MLVGDIGIANVRAIAVLERSTEIGIRRTLGVSRRHIRYQFLAEAILLPGLGETAGTITGALATLATAAAQGWPTIIPAQATAAGLAVASPSGGVAGVMAAIRAARLSPTAARILTR
jgi:putative ABC transport system permease protein